MAVRVSNRDDPLLAAVLAFAPMWKAIASAGFRSQTMLYLLFSGGPDSVGLALALRSFARLAASPPSAGLRRFTPPALGRVGLTAALKFLSRPREIRLTLLHLNHQLRPTADEEEEWVRRFARRHGLCCVCERKDVATFARQKRTSVEDAGRILRYNLLQEKLEDDPTALGFTAHTLDDNAESVLYSLAQRAGIAGMLGIAPALHGRILRPFLFVRKQTILKELRRRRQKFLTDETNLLSDRPRTFLRHAVVPRMQDLNPKFLENALATCDNLRSYEGLFRWALSTVTEIAVAEDRRWRRTRPLPLLPELTWHAFAPDSWGQDIAGSLQVVLHHLLRSFGASLDWAVCARLAEEIRSSHGFRASGGPQITVEYHSPSGLLLIVRRGELEGCELGEGRTVLGSNLLQVERVRGERLRSAIRTLAASDFRVCFKGTPRLAGGEPGGGALYEAVFASNVAVPLQVRAAKRGDRVVLPSSQGSTKLSDVFINAKIPQSLRSNWPVVTNAEGKVLWLPGLLRSGEARVSGRARSGLRLSWEVQSS
ncbi:MAG: tRNA lysidine(34) synthetase TilS [Candidatus Riflebacteria bacterium RBG_13_59_9]|nr:MAG: tRNA lysidine(34) synthetase TilS [Candidatus Riflebacteria bacterium RBG_13_59_9]